MMVVTCFILFTAISNQVVSQKAENTLPVTNTLRVESTLKEDPSKVTASIITSTTATATATTTSKSATDVVNTVDNTDSKKTSAVNSNYVNFTVMTTKGEGNVVVQVHPEWAPLGAERFLQLIDEHYYDGCKFFRVIKVRKRGESLYGIFT